MGCDIHIHVEINKTVNGVKKWVCADYFKLNPYYGEDDEERQYTLVGFCDDRNYSMFATLANVRNYGDTPYISEPRGLPYNACKEVKKDAEDWGDDAHSHSYLTLQELIDFKNSGVKLKHRGMISREAQIALDNHTALPSEWCQMTNMDGWDWREWEEDNTTLDELIDALKRRADDFYFIYLFEWEKDFQKAYDKSKDIRIVFWFDN